MLFVREKVDSLK